MTNCRFNATRIIFPPEHAFGVFLKLKTSSSNGLFFQSFLLELLEAMIKFNKIRKGEVLYERFADKEK